MKIFTLLAPLIFFGSAMAQTPRSDWKLAPVSSLQKLTAKQNGRLEPFKIEPVQLRAARGEWENFQFVVTAGQKPIEKLEITPNGLASIISDLIPAQNLQIYRENYVFVAQPSGNRDLTPKWWPDALIPLSLASKSIEAGKSAVFWASLKIPADAVPGDYYGEIDFKADGAPRRLALTLTVEKAKLPPPTIRGTVALYYDVLRDWYSKNAGKTFTDTQWAVQKKRFYDFLLDYGLNAYDLPVAWNSPEADDYLKNPRVLSVRTPPLDSPDFAVALEKFKATKTRGKAFYYWIDEPQTPAQFAQVRAATAKLRPLGIKHLVTAHPHQSLKDAVDIWCPNLGDFFGIGHLDWKALAAERKRGRETWFYTMVEPKFPYPTWLLDDDAASMRAFGPLMARHGLGGFVYSMAHGWGPKPLENLQSFAATNGDGTLIYPAEIVGGVGPMPSIRLMLLRDAMEGAALGGTRHAVSGASTMRRFPVETADTTRRVPPNSATSIKRQGVPDTKVSWRFDAKRQNLIVNFRAEKPQNGDYLAVELGPFDLEKRPEKWRFVATRKGNLAVEKWTREGHFRFELEGFHAAVQNFPEFYRVEMTIPLTVLEGATKFRFDALRRTSVNGAKITLYAHSRTGDPYAMPVIDLKAK